MSTSADIPLSVLTDVGAPLPLWDLSERGDDDLLALQRRIGEVSRRVEAAAAAVAAEVAHRSRRELGYSGLAQRLGARTPELLIQRETGSSSHQARALIRVGSLLAAPDRDVSEPWLSEVGDALRAGSLSLSAADGLRTGLGAPDDRTDGGALAGAARLLVAEAPGLTSVELGIRARQARDLLDAEGIVDRERARREQRYLRFTRQPDGMTRISGLLDPESAAVVVSAYDAATSPRRGGPRFADARGARRAEGVLRDERTTDQLAVDSLVDLVRLGARTDPNAPLGGRPPAVQVIVTDADLRARAGRGGIEGTTASVSISTVERVACEAGIVPILFDSDGQVVNVGRDQRLFTRRQRVGLAVRDGGCRFPGCDRPPSWCEAHHIDEWGRDHGSTDIADGVLLCRHHHLLVHDNGWRMRRDGGRYELVPPAALDPERTPIPAPAKVLWGPSESAPTAVSAVTS